MGAALTAMLIGTVCFDAKARPWGAGNGIASGRVHSAIAVLDDQRGGQGRDCFRGIGHC